MYSIEYPQFNAVYDFSAEQKPELEKVARDTYNVSLKEFLEERIEYLAGWSQMIAGMGDWAKTRILDAHGNCMDNEYIFEDKGMIRRVSQWINYHENNYDLLVISVCNSPGSNLDRDGVVLPPSKAALLYPRRSVNDYDYQEQAHEPMLERFYFQEANKPYESKYVDDDKPILSKS